MAAPVIGTRPRNAPSAGAAIDVTHPLARSLEFCFVPSVATVDLARNYPSSKTGSPAFGANGFGRSASIRSSTSDGYIFNAPDAPFQGPISFHLLFRQLSASNNFVLMLKSATDQSAPFELRLGNSASPQSVTLARTTARSYTTSSGCVTTNQDTALTISIVGNGIESAPTFIVNGAIVAHTSAGAGTGSPGGTNAALRCAPRTNGAIPPDYLLTCAYVWSRGLTLAEAAQLYADPFCFLKY